jgi:hypothetical protein
MEKGEKRLRAARGALHLASNPVVAVKAGVVVAGIARFGWSVGTSLTDGWEIGTHLSDALEGSCVGELNAIEEDGAVHLKPFK